MVYKVFLRAFQLGCVCFTIFVWHLCIHRYNQQKDNSIVDYQWYHEQEKDIYPTISICLYGVHIVFSSARLENIDRRFNGKLYSQFLQGVYWNDAMINVDYDDVTINFLDYLSDIKIVLTDGEELQWTRNTLLTLRRKQYEDWFYTSFRAYNVKCFSMDINFKHRRTINMVKIELFKNTFLQVGDPEVANISGSVRMFMHYPRQLLRTAAIYDEKIGNESISIPEMRFNIHNMEVLRRRNGGNNQPCNIHSRQDDNYIRYDVIKKVGCVPPHWRSHMESASLDIRSTRICTSQEEMGMVQTPEPLFVHSEFLKNYTSPCDSIFSIGMMNKLIQRDGTDTEQNVLRFEWRFWNPTYKEVRHVPAYDEMVLFAAIGGYSGMVLGLSFLQIPDLLKAAFQFFLHCYGGVEVSTGETKKTEITENRIARMS